jgi:6-phosphogluconolactonase
VAQDVDLRVLDDPAAAAAELLADAARAGGHVALAGGRTVGAAYRSAAGLAPDWSSVDVWWGDERTVPPDDERSNFRLTRETLLDLLEVAPRAVHRVEGELGAEEAARRYDAALEGVTLDLALNGIGADGHTASLFPHSPPLDEAERRAVAAEPKLEPFVPRVTLTPPVFAATSVLVYLVTGLAKADAVRRAFVEEPSPATPASLVRGRRTVALLDRGAAARL